MISFLCFLKVHFFLKRREGNLSEVEVSRLNSWALGLRVLAALPLPWQQRCSSLHEYPHLILEVLLMRKQLPSATLVRKFLMLPLEYVLLILCSHQVRCPFDNFFDIHVLLFICRFLRNFLR